MRAVVYGNSESVKDFCENKGYEVCGYVSGELSALSEKCKEASCEVCIISDFSHLGNKFAETISALSAEGIETVFLCSDGRFSPDAGFVCSLIKDLKQSFKPKQDRKEKSGIHFPTSVYGYERASGGAVKIEPSEAETVKSIFIMFTAEKKGTSKIASILNEKGIKTKRGHLWNQVTVSRVLANPVYTGKVKTADGEEKEIHPEIAIVDSSLFEAAKEKLEASKDAFSHRKKNTPYALSGLIKCKDCGCAFRRLERKYKNSYVRWVCMGRNMNGASTCPNKTAVDEGELIAAIKDYFNQLIATENGVKRIISTEYNRYHGTDIEGKKNLDEILNGAFEKMKKVIEQNEVTNELLTSVIEKIAVDGNGNVDIYLRLFSEIGVDRHIVQGLY